MKTDLKPLFDKRDMEKWLQIFNSKAEDKIITLLQGAGEMFVRYARESGNYDDHTGNLRSSIGYVILSDGVAEVENFEKQNVGTDGEKGVSDARQLAYKLAESYKNGFVLIGLAGMEYAAAVEAKGRDVITSGNIQMQEWLKKAVRTVFKKAG